MMRLTGSLGVCMLGFGPLLATGLVVIGLAGCNNGDPPVEEPCAGRGLTQVPTFASRFAGGNPDGHPDPVGARGKAQARASRLGADRPELIRQADNARSRVRAGDFLLLNDKVAFYIEGARTSDGYSSLGGELLAADRVGADGLPLGASQYNETLMTLARQAIAPETVTVLNDGRDGKAAVVRAQGALKNIPFLDTFADLLPGEYNFPAALDYVLEPDGERVLLRLSLINPTAEPVDFNGRRGVGFFQYARSRTFTPANGYEAPTGYAPFVAFDSDGGFAFRTPGSPLRALVSVSGFDYYQPGAFAIDACETKTVDYAEVIPGGPGLDGLLAAVRRVDGDTSFRAVTGTVKDSAGAALPGATVHVLAEDGALLTHATAAADGSFTVHAPPRPVKLLGTLAGHEPSAEVALAPGANTAAVQIPRDGTITVKARDAADGTLLPVRVQVIPVAAPRAVPAKLGVPTEANGRLWQDFPMKGETALRVPPGMHKVIVSRGPEWEIVEQTVTVAAGATVPVAAQLVHSVDSRGVMCADFHIHSNYSADSADPVEAKVRGAVADGLEIPVSSEHEWIIDPQHDFQKTITALEVTAFSYGMPSEEFTTFTWGHFGIIPIRPRTDVTNNGAVQWIGRRPAEVFREIRDLPEKPVLIVNHPSGGGFGAYFSAVHFRRDLATGDPDMWSDEFGAVEVFNDSDFEENRTKSVADWFALLNAGKIVWAVGSSDSHGMRTSPVGYPRTCLRFGHDDPRHLTPELVRDALRAGKATIAGGLYMTVEGPGGTGPGAMLPPGAGAREFNVVVQAPSWLEAKTLEVIVDGETKSTVQLQASVGGPARRYEARVMVSATRSQAPHWVVFHASGGGRDLSPVSPGRKAFAVSNPFFW